LDRVTAGNRGVPPCFDVSFAVRPGATYALVGREGSGKGAIVGCLLGRLKPQAGSVRVFGVDPRRHRWALRRRVRHIRPGDAYVPGSRPAPELFVHEGNAPRERLAGTTTVIVGSDPRVAAAAESVAFLKEGRLVREENGDSLTERFRRIRYVNELTEARTEFGNELDAFDAVRVKVRGWGVDAVVANFDDAAFRRFRAMEGVEDAVALPMTLEEIFDAVVG
jgi:ABC-type multidrug transport system ATPase subunit